MFLYVPQCFHDSLHTVVPKPTCCSICLVLCKIIFPCKFSFYKSQKTIIPQVTLYLAIILVVPTPQMFLVFSNALVRYTIPHLTFNWIDWYDLHDETWGWLRYSSISITVLRLHDVSVTNFYWGPWSHDSGQGIVSLICPPLSYAFASSHTVSFGGNSLCTAHG